MNIIIGLVRADLPLRLGRREAQTYVFLRKRHFASMHT